MQEPFTGGAAAGSAPALRMCKHIQWFQLYPSYCMATTCLHASLSWASSHEVTIEGSGCRAPDVETNYSWHSAVLPKVSTRGLEITGIQWSMTQSYLGLGSPIMMSSPTKFELHLTSCSAANMWPESKHGMTAALWGKKHRLLQNPTAHTLLLFTT